MQRDALGLVLAEVTFVPPHPKPEQSSRIHISLRPAAERKAHWNNEGEPLQLWVDAPPGWQLERHLFRAPQGDKPETSEPRQFELDVRAPPTREARHSSTRTRFTTSAKMQAEPVGSSAWTFPSTYGWTNEVHEAFRDPPSSTYRR